ncbi:hypothetical protein [Saccharicrinis sp. 156]|uniref:hypothetical protein n=1 Tax=Saccharicrinis sp. 156 TaxID=3417574 RepID=UPI003D35013B
MTDANKEAFKREIPFSLIIKIEQQPLKDEELDSLYEGLMAVNELEIMGRIDLEADLES